MQIIHFKTGIVAITHNEAEAKEACLECYNDIYRNHSNLLLDFFLHDTEKIEHFEKAIKNYEDSIEKTNYILKALEEENVADNSYLVIELKRSLQEFNNNKKSFEKKINTHYKIYEMYDNQDIELIYDFVKKHFITKIVYDENIKLYDMNIF